MDDADNKLVKAKEQLARQRSQKGVGTGFDVPARDRLPPGQHLVQGWPVLDLGIKPDISSTQWKLAINGAAQHQTLDWDDFRSLPQTALVTDFHCVTSWSIFDARVEGVLWRDLVPLLGIAADATHVVLSSSDGYTTNVSLEDMSRPDVALVHSFGGEPLSREHGGPVRVWIPHLYAWKSAKWLRGIDFQNADKRGFWEVRGYHNRGDPWKEERFS